MERNQMEALQSEEGSVQSGENLESLAPAIEKKTVASRRNHSFILPSIRLMEPFRLPGRPFLVGDNLSDHNTTPQIQVRR